MSAPAAAAVSVERTVPRSVLVAAGAVPLMVLGGFAMLAVVPVGVVLRRVLATPGLRRLRPAALALGAAYAVPLVLWAVLPDRAPSLTKDMHPASVALVVAVAVGFLAVCVLDRARRPRQDSNL